MIFDLRVAELIVPLFQRTWTWGLRFHIISARQVVHCRGGQPVHGSRGYASITGLLTVTAGVVGGARLDAEFWRFWRGSNIDAFASLVKCAKGPRGLRHACIVG